MATEASTLIRPVLRSELPAVHAIEQVCFRNPWPLQIFELEMDHDWSRLWGAFRPGGEALLGYLLFWLVYDEIHVLNLATHPAERRRSVARALLRRLDAEARRLESRFLTLEVRMSNAAALCLYETEGFEVVGRRPKYYTDNAEDALVMLKNL